MPKKPNYVKCPVCDYEEALLIDGDTTCPECGYDEATENTIKESVWDYNNNAYEQYN